MRLSLVFNEDYYNIGDKGYKDYKDYPHFLERAKFIKEVLKAKKVIVLGGAYGFLTKRLLDLDVESVTIDNSDYAYKQKAVFDENYIKNDIINLPKYTVFATADWIVSWNVLDCLSNDIVAKEVGEILNKFEGKQLHIMCMVDNEPYENDGYFIREQKYWKELLPNACLVDYDTKKIIQKPIDYEEIKSVPLNWGMVTE